MNKDLAPNYLLEASGITKRFPGVVALDGVKLNIRPGEVHALVGENGAGKSTLMKIIGGVYTSDEGSMLLNGNVYAPQCPADAQSLGISLIHQELDLVPDLSVAQNIFLGREPMVRGRILSEKKAIRESERILKSIGLEIDPRVKVSKLTVASQQMVEIAKAVSVDTQLLVMDEPTAALSEKEVNNLFSLIRSYLSPKTAVIYISHRMEELFAIADRVTVYRDGRFIAEKTIEETSPDELVHLMVGREIQAYSRPEVMMNSDLVALEVKHLSTSLLKDCSIRVRPGEILGLGGLAGAGRTELARAIFGADPFAAGEIYVHGKRVKVKNPTDAVKRGIAYLSEDRKRYGLVLGESIEKNIVMASLNSYVSRLGLIRDSAIKKTANVFINKLQIKTPHAKQNVKNLSGGNQQKVVIAKWLERNCDVLIFDEPTRGIDVGAKQEINSILEDLASKGRAIIVISSELEELLRVSDRIVVMCNGAITGELTHDEATQERIMNLATAFDAEVEIGTE